MEEPNALETLQYQVTSLIHLAQGQSILEYALIVFITFMLGRWLSSFAQGFTTRVIATFFGLIMISNSFRIAGFVITSGLILGVGLISPHITYFLNYILETVFKVQAFTINTYYIFITIWYKIIRFFRWIISPFTKIKFKRANFRSKNTSTNNSRKTTYSNSNRRTKNNNYEKEYQEYTNKHYSNYQQQNSSSNNSNNENTSSSSSSYNNNYQEQTYQEEQATSNQSSGINNNTRHDGVNLEEQLKDDPEYAQFFSTSVYIVLGVDDSMSLKEIRKKYKKLLRIYHPDLNPDIEDIATIISQKINGAFEKIVKMNR
jgi:hypothetical protein